MRDVRRALRALADLERLVGSEGASRIILARDQVAIPLLQAARSPRVTVLVEGVVRLDIRTPRDEVVEEVQQVLVGRGRRAAAVPPRLMGTRSEPIR